MYKSDLQGRLKVQVHTLKNDMEQQIYKVGLLNEKEVVNDRVSFSWESVYEDILWTFNRNCDLRRSESRTCVLVSSGCLKQGFMKDFGVQGGRSDGGRIKFSGIGKRT